MAVPILLPPSEGKTAPASGPVLDLGSLSFADQLTTGRQEVMAHLSRVSAGRDGGKTLDLGPKAARELELNTVLGTAPCAPAHSLFTGVLYEAADLRALAGRAFTSAALEAQVLVLSGLWGLLRPCDMVPNHRAAMGLSLPGLGKLSAFWRPHLEAVLTEHCRDSVVVDCRSADYASAWQPPAGTCELLQVRVVAEREGRRKVVSHHAKHTRGLLAGALVRAVAQGLEALGSAQGVAETASRLEGVVGVELGEPDRRGRRVLTLVVA